MGKTLQSYSCKHGVQAKHDTASPTEAASPVQLTTEAGHVDVLVLEGLQAPLKHVATLPRRVTGLLAPYPAMLISSVSLCRHMPCCKKK